MRASSHPATLRQIQYFVAVADRANFRKAAEDCHVSQPSLSAQVAQLEEALGVRLFERDRRKVLVTEAGKILVEQARSLLLAMDDLVESARRLRNPLSVTLRLGVIPTIGPYLLPDLAPLLRERYPELTQIWREEKTDVLMRLLRNGEIDGAIVALESELGDVDSVILGKDPFVLALPPSHPLGRSGRRVRVAELEGERLLLLDDGHCFRDQALGFCKKAGAGELSVRATSLPTLAQMAAAGSGITLLPSMAVDVENRRGTLRIRRFAEEPPSRTVALVWRRNSALESTLRPIGRTLRDAYRAR